MPDHDYVIELEGHSADLELLAHCFNNDRCRVVKVGIFTYELRSPEFRLGDNPERVPVLEGGKTAFAEFDKNYEVAGERAQAIIKSMVGAARLVRARTGDVNVSLVRKRTLDGREVGAAARSGGDYERSEHALPAERGGLPALMRIWVNTGMDDERVQSVLQMYAGLPISWSRCFLIMEEVAADCGGQQALEEFIDKKLARRVRLSAHRARSIEEGPRHAGPLPKDWDPSEAMSLMDADSAIKGTVVRWLAKKTGTGRIPA